VDEPRITAAELSELLRETIPLTRLLDLRVTEIGWGTCTVLLPGSETTLRAGGTVSGPALFAMADTALYGAVLSRIGLEPLAVTSDLSLRFLRKPPPDDLHGVGTLIRLGRRQAVGEVRLFGADPDQLVAHATGTYSLPL